MSPLFGGSRLIHEQLQILDADLAYMGDFGSIASFILGYGKGNSKNKKMKRSKGGSQNWTINLIHILVLYFISNIDIFWKIRLRKYIRANNYSVILCNYPTFFNAIRSALRKSEVEIYLFEHNVEFLFFRFVLPNNIYNKILLRALKYIEFNAVKQSDTTIVLSKEDKKNLLNFTPGPNANIVVWTTPPIDTLKPKEIKELAHKYKNKEFEDKLRRRPVVGFIGSNFKPNIESVKNILFIANKDPGIYYLILGSVANSFRTKIPDNVYFAGFVDSLEYYLSLCDIFINPKSIMPTGVEIKMYDYLKFNKPIIATRIGANGFEKFSQIIIEDKVEKYAEIIRTKVTK